MRFDADRSRRGCGPGSVEEKDGPRLLKVETVPATPDDLHRLNARRGVWSRVLQGVRGLSRAISGITEAPTVRVLRGTTDRAFVPAPFDGDRPRVAVVSGGHVVAFCGQWVYDPHTVDAEQGWFEAWEPEQSFPAEWECRLAMPSGVLLSFRPLTDAMITVEGVDPDHVPWLQGSVTVTESAEMARAVLDRLEQNRVRKPEKDRGRGVSPSP